MIINTLARYEFLIILSVGAFLFAVEYLGQAWLVVFLQINTYETPQALPSSEKQRLPRGCQNTLINDF